MRYKVLGFAGMGNWELGIGKNCYKIVINGRCSSSLYLTDRMSNPANSNPDETRLPESWSYETTVAEVETIIEKIEAGELDLADVFEQFTAAIAYLRQCEIFLNQRQQQVDLLIETLSSESDF